MSILEQLGIKYDTDKVTHGFCKIYDEYFMDKKDEIKTFLEVGVFFGASILMWKDYFPQATIHGMDVFSGKQGNGTSFPNPTKFYDECERFQIPRIKLHKYDQSIEEELIAFRETVNEKFDCILDDASHLMKDQQTTFALLFPLINYGGVYIIEDLHTSLQTGYDVKSDSSNSTLKMVQRFIRTKRWESEYMSRESIDILTAEVESAVIKYNGQSITCFIKKISQPE